MTEKQTNRFTDFTFGQRYDREVTWKKTKNGFHHHGQILAWCLNKTSYQLLNQQTAFCLKKLHITLQITLTSSYNIVDHF